MRDAQSLLEQLLASGHAKLTVEVVHSLLGTASDERLLDMIDALADHDAATALGLLDKAASEGVQPSELLGGLLEFLRDAMVLAAGADSLLLAVTPRQRPRLKKVIDRWPLDTVMTALQILAEARSRMRGSPHGRIIVEVALVKVARLENFAELGEIIQHLGNVERGGGGIIAAPPRPGSTTGSPAPSSLKKKPIADELSVPDGPPDLSDPPRQASPGIGNRSGTGETPPATPPASLDAIASEPLDIAEVRHAWPELIKKVGPNIAWRLSLMEPVEIEGPDVLVISPKPGYNGSDDLLEAPGAREKIEQTLRRLVRRHISVRYEPGQDRPGRSSEPSEPTGKPRGVDALSSDPLVRKVVELFEARPFHLDLETEGED
jgi:DNA polymerase-3 subunit gamma/tau